MLRSDALVGMPSVMERRDCDGVGQAWDRWVERVNGPSDPKSDAPREEHEPWTVRRAAETAAAIAAIGAALVVADRVVGINWGWIPWKQIFVVAAIVVALAGACARAMRALLRRRRGLPQLRDERAARREAWAERVRALDEPHLRRERTTVGD